MDENLQTINAKPNKKKISFRVKKVNLNKTVEQFQKKFKQDI